LVQGSNSRSCFGKHQASLFSLLPNIIETRSDCTFTTLSTPHHPLTRGFTFHLIKLSPHLPLLIISCQTSQQLEIMAIAVSSLFLRPSRFGLSISRPLANYAQQHLWPTTFHYARNWSRKPQRLEQRYALLMMGNPLILQVHRHCFSPRQP
jgi:hypothetical protein